MLALQDVGVGAVVVAHGGDLVVAPVNEAPRLETEELGGLQAELRVVPWDADPLDSVPRGGRVGTDVPAEGLVDVAAAVEAIRRGLTDPELDRYRALGRDAAAALTEALQAVGPDSTEWDAAAAAAGALVARAIDPVVLLVAGAARLPHHRHPLPTRERLGGLAMVVVCARRGGLIASLTRFVAFGGLPAHLRDAYDRLLRVDVAFNRATVPGARVGDVFAAGTAAYAANGFGADEWRLHHQGGPTGYAPRDYLATAASDEVVVEAQAFAWNPSVPSLKSEDTIVARAAGPEILTVDPDWPTATVDGLARPLVLER